MLRVYFMRFTSVILAGLFLPNLPAAMTSPASPHYQVTLSGAGGSVSPFVHFSRAQKPDSNRSKDISWASFALDGRVAIRIGVTGRSVSQVKILPSSRAVAVTLTDGIARFELDHPGQYAVEFDGDGTHPLFLFAEPPEKDAPSATDPDVLYFGPGEHPLGDKFIEPKAGQTVYLAPGAIVHGRIRITQAPGVTIRGRGILRGGHLPGNPPNTYTVPHAIEADQASSGVTVEGITVVESPHYQILLRGDDCVVRNVKLMGWWFGTDGIGTGRRGLVEDSFLRCNDDALKLYQSGMVVRRCVIWQMENGAPFQLSWNMNPDNAGFRVSDIDIIAVDHHQDANNRAIFNSIHGGRAHLSDYLFENIRIENARFRLLMLQIKKTNWAKAKEWGRLSNITLRNISADGPFTERSVISSDDPDGRIDNVIFENVRIGGKPVKGMADLGLEIDPGTVSGLQFLP